MGVSDALWEIESAIDDVFDLHERTQLRRKAQSRRNVYEKALREVQETAGTEEMYTLGDWIAEEIRTQRRFPSGREVRRRGAEICRDSGHGVSTGSWLGA